MLELLESKPVLQLFLTHASLAQRHRDELEAGRMELAMTGKAFTELDRSELMVQLLFYTRIFSRFSPEQKAGLPSCPDS